MKLQVNLFSLAVRGTVIALGVCAVLLVLGVFNRALDWCLVDRQTEHFLRGLFKAFAALSALGAALTAVLGIDEIVRSLKKILFHEDESPCPPDFVFSFSHPVVQFGVFVTGLALLVGVLNVSDNVVRSHRNAVFKSVAAVTLEEMRTRFAKDFSGEALYPENGLPRAYKNLLSALGSIPFVTRATVYLNDPDVDSYLWKGSLRDGRENFTRLFVSTDSEKQVKAALGGAADAAEKLNASAPPFVFYYLLRGSSGTPAAVVRIDGSRRDHYRDYGSATAAGS